MKNITAYNLIVVSNINIFLFSVDCTTWAHDAEKKKKKNDSKAT